MSKLLKEIITENFPSFANKQNTYKYRNSRTGANSRQKKSMKFMPKHIIAKRLKIKVKEKNLENF